MQGYFINLTKPSILRMAAQVLDWGDSLNPRRRKGKWLTMLVMFVGCLVLGETQKIILFLLHKTYAAGVFHSCQNPNQGYPVNNFSQFLFVVSI